MAECYLFVGYRKCMWYEVLSVVSIKMMVFGEWIFVVSAWVCEPVVLVFSVHASLFLHWWWRWQFSQNNWYLFTKLCSVWFQKTILILQMYIGTMQLLWAVVLLVASMSTKCSSSGRLAFVPSKHPALLLYQDTVKCWHNLWVTGCCVGSLEVNQVRNLNYLHTVQW